MATHSISTVSARAALKPRHEPYWHKLAQGCHLGYRKLTNQSEGVWWARYIEPGTNKKSHHSLGSFAHLANNQKFDAAKRDAEAWFAHIGKGGISAAKTVRNACENYVSHIKTTKGDSTAKDIQKRFDGYVLNIERFAETELSKLTPAIIGDWRKRLAELPVTQGRRGRSRQSKSEQNDSPTQKKRTASTLNRDMTPFRAALNLAFKDGWVTSDFAWKGKLAPVKAADQRRSLYLDKTQRAELIAAATGNIKAFLHGLAVLPLRPGALASLHVKDFDARLSQLAIRIDKTGQRKIKIPPQAAALLSGLCEGKIANASIFSRADGAAWDKDSWKGPIKEAVRAAALPEEVTAYTLRHSVITDLVHSGLDLLTVAQLSGTSVRMIEAHYGHLRSEIAMPALEALAL